MHRKNRKFTCNLNDKIILRGHDNYYFGYCYLSDLNVTKNEIIKILKKVLVFVKNANEHLNSSWLKNNYILDLKI